MAFNYNDKKHNDNESFWTSYSDLFLGLSSIFLMLYVVASLRSGTDGMKNIIENKKMRVEVEDLKNQLKTYEQMKENYINSQASRSEVDEYNELMDKLSLLKDEANDEKNKLRDALVENDNKAKALNKYQQIVRNVINSSTLSKVKINNRNEIITERDTTIDVQDQKIEDLNQNISSMNATIKSKEAKISEAQKQLSHKQSELKKLAKMQKISQKVYQDRVKKLQEASQLEIQKLQNQKSIAQRNLEQSQKELSGLQADLSQTKSALSNSLGELEKSNEKIGALNNKIGQLGAESQAKIAGMKKAFADQQARDLAGFQEALGRQKNLGAAEIARQKAAFDAAAAEKEKNHARNIASIAGQLKDTEDKLEKANAELATRKKIAEEIRNGFKKIGVKADIDMGTGDVVLDFGGAHFDSDSADLKNEMKTVLNKAVPIYAKALFGNEKISKEISAVEVVGFASPTYQGKIIDPNSTSPKDREALKYNMDLSYKRARSIFNYIIDENLNYAHKNNLVPNLKVSGRSFLDLMKTDRSIASVQDYCLKNDCKKSQKVIIKFSMNKK